MNRTNDAPLWKWVLLSVFLFMATGVLVFFLGPGRAIREGLQSFALDLVSATIALAVGIILIRLIRNPKLRLITLVVGGILLLDSVLILKGGFPPSPLATAVMVTQFVGSVAFVAALRATSKWLK